MDPGVREGLGWLWTEHIVCVYEALQESAKEACVHTKVSVLNKVSVFTGRPIEEAWCLVAADWLQIHAFSSASLVSWVGNLSCLNFCFSFVEVQ